MRFWISKRNTLAASLHRVCGHQVKSKSLLSLDGTEHPKYYNPKTTTTK